MATIEPPATPDTVALRTSPELEAALRTVSAAYVAANPASRALFERATRSLPGGNTRSVLAYDPFPLYIARSHGATIEDIDGHAYLDVLGEYSAGLYGHGNAAIHAAIVAATDAGAVHGGPVEAEIGLAEALCRRFPSVERIRFCNSGTEANLYALTLAKNATHRPAVLCFQGAYHGGLLAFAGAGSAMNVPFDWRIGCYNDIAGTRAAIRAAASELAAVIVEPMMSNAGSIPATPEFLGMLRTEASAAGALLVFDEVVTSRMGAGGLQGRYGIRPDLTTFGKYLGGGFSFGAFGGAAAIMTLLDSGAAPGLTHAGTFNNNVFSMTAGLAGLAHVFTAERADAFFAQGEALRERLNAIARDHDVPVRFTGCGSVMNVHFTRDPIVSPADVPNDTRGLLKLYHLDMFALGIYAARRGLITLSLAMTGADLDRLVAAFATFSERRRDVIASVVR